MIEILLLIGAVRYLSRLADSRGKSKKRWGFLSAIIYIVCGLLGAVIFPLLIGASPPLQRMFFWWPATVGYLIFALSGLLFVRLYLSGLPQVHAMEGEPRHSSRSSERAAGDLSVSCSSCVHGAERNARELWCGVKEKIVLWNSTCTSFEPRASSADSVPEPPA